MKLTHVECYSRVGETVVDTLCNRSRKTGNAAPLTPSARDVDSPQEHLMTTTATRFASSRSLWLWVVRRRHPSFSASCLWRAPTSR